MSAPALNQTNKPGPKKTLTMPAIPEEQNPHAQPRTSPSPDGLDTGAEKHKDTPTVPLKSKKTSLRRRRSPVASEKTPPDPSDPESQNPKEHRFLHCFENAPPLTTFVALTWLDILTQLLCTGLAFIIYMFMPLILPRRIPLSSSSSHDELLSSWTLKHAKPYRGEYVSTNVSALVSFAVPLTTILLVGTFGGAGFWELHAAIMALGYALSTSTLLQVLLKIFIGGLRPHFLDACKLPPTIPISYPKPHSPAQPHSLFPNHTFLPNTTTTTPTVNRTLSTTTAAKETTYTLFPPSIAPLHWISPNTLCTCKPHTLREIQMSFPSGHAAAAFAGFGFLALYLGSRLDVFQSEKYTVNAQRQHDRPRGSDVQRRGDESGSSGRTREEEEEEDGADGRRGGGAGYPRVVRHWKVLVFVVPWLVAVVISGSKIRDDWHHPVDVVGGAVVGGLLAVWAYRVVYKGV